jgi:membrane protein implicated in regulation of membrane protease activity
MSWFFMFPLGTFLVAVYIFKNSAEEITYLSACIAGVSLLLTLVSAPWQLQCLLLMFVLLSTRGQSLSSQPPAQSQSQVQSQEDETTKLVYRGANYEATPPTVEKPEGESTGKYRGQFWKVHNPLKAPVPQPPLSIKYRGAKVSKQNQPTRDS